MEPMQSLRQDTEELSAIFRVEFENPAAFTDLLVNHNLIEAKVLEREKDGKCIVFFKSKPRPDVCALRLIKSGKGYLLLPFELYENRLRVTFFGTPKQVTEFLETMEKTGITFKIMRSTKAKFTSDPLSALTEKQRTVITTAYNFGYYDFPRKINSEQLSKKLNIHSPAAVAHRRKAERRILAQLIKE
jgi:hypothetical protein